MLQECVCWWLTEYPIKLIGKVKLYQHKKKGISQNIIHTVQYKKSKFLHTWM